MNKKEILSELKILGAKIGMMELQRMRGIYIPIKDLIKVKREFRTLSNKYYEGKYV